VKIQGIDPGGRPTARREWWGHVAVGCLACGLTVTIVGSLAYLAFRKLERDDTERRIAQFVSALENRSPEELTYAVRELQQRPGLARRVLPAILVAAQKSGSERQQLAAVSLCRAFVDNPQVEEALFRIRLARTETVAAAAVDLLREVRPASQAAERLAGCLDSPWPAVIDTACSGLLELGEPGAARLAESLPRLDEERRVWLVGLLAERRPETAEGLLERLRRDASAAVRRRAERAMAAAETNKISSINTVHGAESGGGRRER